jgi:hypothetical protein
MATLSLSVAVKHAVEDQSHEDANTSDVSTKDLTFRVVVQTSSDTCNIANFDSNN